MSGYRKPRPLQRGANRLRDDRLFLVACDDTYAPKQYFGFFRIPRVQVFVVSPGTEGMDSLRVLDMLRQVDHEEQDERWLVLDTDHFTQPQHSARFLSTLQQARQSGIHVALSRPCFEVWLLLHHHDEDHVKHAVNCREVEQLLRQALGEYNKRNLKNTHFPRELVDVARARARRLDQRVEGGDIPQSATTRIYKLWDAILGDSGDA